MRERQSSINEALSLIRSYRAFATGLATWSKPLGFSADGCLILLMLRDTRGASNTELADALGLNLSTATKIIDRLVSDNFVHRKPDPIDRRRIQIYLTDRGDEVSAEASRQFEAFMQDIPKAR